MGRVRCIRCHVSGKVQGVFYRASTQQQARSLGLNGYARNLDDGSVEVVACGEQGQLERLERWLWQGPQHAAVSAVRCEYTDIAVPNGFTIG